VRRQQQQSQQSAEQTATSTYDADCNKVARHTAEGCMCQNQEIDANNQKQLRTPVPEYSEATQYQASHITIKIRSKWE
jgi:hypothetical protein